MMQSGEMADAVDSEERPPEVSAAVWILYSAPTYPSDHCLPFPQELIDRICEFLRLDPFTLLRCRLVCHAWYHAAVRVAPNMAAWLQLRNRAALDDYAHMLLSNNNRSFGKRFDELAIWENPRKPFIHTWPMRIPGYLLPRVKVLELHDFDGAATRPHDLFFHFLSYYTSITALKIEQCRFRSMTELRRISNALPGLQDLFLTDITLQHPLVPSLVSRRYIPRSRNKLKKLSLRCSTSESGAHAREHRQLLADICTTYSGSCVKELELNLNYCSSLSHLHQILCHFPELSRLSLQHAFGSRVEPASAADVALYTTQPPNPSLSHFELLYVPESWASQILLILTPQACSRLEGLQFHLAAKLDSDTKSCADLVPRFTEILSFAGAALKTFDYECYLTGGDSIHDVVPRLAANTSLTKLTLDFHSVDRSHLRIHKDLGTVLSHIRSPHLEQLNIGIHLSHSETSEDGPEASVSETDPPGSTSTFHALLSRRIFDQLPAVPKHWLDSAGVSITVDSEGPLQTATMSAIKARMIALFAPWLDRGVLQLTLRPDPDGEDIVTRNPLAVFSDLGTHASITEMRDSDNGEREGSARNASGGTEAEEESSLAWTTCLDLRD